MRAHLFLGTIVSLVLASAPPVSAQFDPAAPVELEVSGSPFVAANEGAPITVTVTLAEPAELRLRITDFDGRHIRDLFDGDRPAGVLTRTWHGRDDDGEIVPDGPYRVEATVAGDAGGSNAAEAWVAVAERKVYPRRPGFITVAIDPGHGGRLSGAVGADGTREADLNLDIGLRLARMLEAAGVNVVITRTTDEFVNTPEEDRTLDGVIDDDDELAARPDMANEARADLFLSIHNNIAVNESVGGPSTYFYDERPFSGRSARLARMVQREMVAALGDIIPGGYDVYDHGALIYPYYVLRGYDPPRLQRPTQMPGVLSEGMFLSNPRELRFLKRRPVRAAMAAAYYDAIARYLARRGSHVGYELVDGPTGPVTSGERVTYRVEVRNQGTESIRGRRLAVGVRGRPPYYVGRPQTGDPAGSARVPRLDPGEAAVVEVAVTVPDDAGEWILLFQATDRSGQRAALEGSPMLQVPLDVVAPGGPSASPASLTPD